MGIENLHEHALSPWLDSADDFVLIGLVGGGFETLPCRSVGDDLFEICCVPFHSYGFDRGDVVTRGEGDVVGKLVRKSGNCGFRFKTDQGADTIKKIVQVLESHGCVVEFEPTGILVAVDAPSFVDQEIVSGVLATFEDSDYLVYETVRLE